MIQELDGLLLCVCDRASKRCNSRVQNVSIDRDEQAFSSLSGFILLSRYADARRSIATQPRTQAVAGRNGKMMAILSRILIVFKAARQRHVRGESGSIPTDTDGIRVGHLVVYVSHMHSKDNMCLYAAAAGYVGRK